MINYSTNFCGPIATKWYEERGLLSDPVTKPNRYAEGGSLEVREITEYWAGGRIDIYGLDYEEYFDGKWEYGLPVMHGEDWNRFSDWLHNLKTEKLLSFDEIFERYYSEGNPTIRWAKERFNDMC